MKNAPQLFEDSFGALPLGKGVPRSTHGTCSGSVLLGAALLSFVFFFFFLPQGFFQFLAASVTSVSAGRPGP